MKLVFFQNKLLQFLPDLRIGYHGIIIYVFSREKIFDQWVCSKNSTAGLVFYPGGKVEHMAYALLMRTCAENGILCAVVRMPGNLAVLNVNAADGLRQTRPEITTWYMAGHSLGGAMAANYFAAHSGDYAGLILLAAYYTKDLSQTSLRALAVYGSEDGGVNQESYATKTGQIFPLMPLKSSWKAAAMPNSAAMVCRLAMHGKGETQKYFVVF